MLKAKMTSKDGNDCFIFGLSEKNIEKLRQGLPIKIQGKEIGLASDIVIFWGKTEESMYKDFVDLIGPQSSVHISPETGIKHEPV